MSSYTVAWTSAVDSSWVNVRPIHIGLAGAGIGTPYRYVLLSEAKQPVLRVDVYFDPEESSAFFDAVIWKGLLVIGSGHRVYFVEIESAEIEEHRLGSYFGHLYAYGDLLLVATAERLFRFDTNGKLQWRSDTLGIDGVVVHDVGDGVICGDGEWDPPHGWKPFRVRTDAGKAVNKDEHFGW